MEKGHLPKKLILSKDCEWEKDHFSKKYLLIK